MHFPQVRSLPLSIVVLSLLIFGCQKDDHKSSSQKDNHSFDATPFGGTWQTNCQQDTKQKDFYAFDQVEFNGGVFINAFSLFTDKTCLKLISTRRQIGTFTITPNTNDKIENAPDKINISPDRVELTIYSAAMVNAYNEILYCGGNWQRKTPKIVSEKLCQDIVNNKPLSIFDILKIESINTVDTLFFGDKSTALSDATSESKRPSTLNLVKPYLKTE